MSKIVHTQLVSDDPQATADFVENLLGWKIEKKDMDGDDCYVWYYPGEKGSDGVIIGAFNEHRDKSPHINILVDADNLGDALAKAKALGATLTMEEIKIPRDMGYLLELEIPGGVKLRLWSKQPSVRKQPQESVTQKK